MRKLLGYVRYDSAPALTAINGLYEELRLLQNLFLPSVKLVEKRRVGARLRRRYDAPRTPLERVEACAEAAPAQVPDPILAQSTKGWPASTASPTSGSSCGAGEKSARGRWTCGREKRAHQGVGNPHKTRLPKRPHALTQIPVTQVTAAMHRR